MFTVEMFYLMCNEGIILKEAMKGEADSLLILRELRSAIYENHVGLKKFGQVLLNYEHTITLGTDIIYDYG